MSTGGIYQLLVNDGKQDRMLTATTLLQDRLKEIRRIRCKHPGIKDTMPTLVDIEKTHVFFMNAHFKPFVQIGYEYEAIQPQEGTANFGQDLNFSIPQFGDFFHDMCLHVTMTGLTAAVAGDKVRYCDFLGHRLLKAVRFEVNRNVLDSYDSEIMNFHYNFFVPVDKKRAWLEGVGQEIPKPAFITQNPGVDNYRELKYIMDGPQTPKDTHARVDMWIPLLFWFNKDPRLSIPSVAIPYGQRYITLLLADVTDVCFGQDYGGGGAFIAPQITKFELFINNIFVNPEIHDIFIKRIGFSMIRVHRSERVPISVGQDEILLDQLKWPMETMYIGIRPTANLATPDRWHKYHLVTDVVTSFPVARPNPFPPPADQLGFSDAIWQTATEMIDTFSILTRAVELYRKTPAKFFNTYIPYTYGGVNVTSPIDPGLYMVTFNLYPGSFQPSGHVNLSRTRELYFKYSSSVITGLVSASLNITIIAINFLLIAEGTAVLRYNT